MHSERNHFQNLITTIYLRQHVKLSVSLVYTKFNLIVKQANLLKYIMLESVTKTNTN